MPKNKSERRDCTNRTTKSPGSFGEACAFKHEPNKKGKVKGRPRALSPTGSPHRNSKGDGKGSDDGNAKGAPKFTGKSPSGKGNKPPCRHFKKKVNQVIIGMPLNVGCKFGDQCKQKHTAESADERKEFTNYFKSHYGE